MRYTFIILAILFVFQSFAQNLTPEEYINKYKFLAIAEMDKFKIPASITMAQAIHESANGNSFLARNGNNHFGIKCQDNWLGERIYRDDDKANECFRKYNSVEESYKDHSEFLINRNRYAFLFKYDSDDYVSWAKGLKSAGYATNPKYADIIISVIEKYELYNLDKKINFIADVSKKSENKKIEYTSSLKKRKILLTNNIKSIISVNGDSYDKIASELDMFPGQILRYNDLKKTDTIKEGDIIYLQPKKGRAKTEFHYYSKGESLRDISQKYGIKLKSLLKKNNLTSEALPEDGQKLYLKKRKK